MEEDEKMAQERKAKIAARKQRKAERLKNKRSRGNAERGGGAGKLVQEFSSGKKEIWIMPGAKEQESFREEAKSHDISHDTAHNVEDVTELLSDNPSSPAALASIVSQLRLARN